MGGVKKLGGWEVLMSPCTGALLARSIWSLFPWQQGLWLEEESCRFRAGGGQGGSQCGTEVGGLVCMPPP